MPKIRDTQFQGFAKALWIELLYACESKVVGNHLVKVPPTKQEAEAIIAQRAYDLAVYVLDQVSAYPELKRIPDMTELPRVTHE